MTPSSSRALVMSSSVPMGMFSVVAEMVTSAVPFEGMLWFIVRILAPVSAK